MCTCDKPTVNGEFGYKWNHPCAGASIYPPNPPIISPGEFILYDEPGRCGGIDSHSYHYRLIRMRYGGIELLVRHGGGDERISRLSNAKAVLNALDTLDSNGRYWLLNAIYHAQSDAERKGREKTETLWKNAAAEKRIKTRKLPKQGAVKVWIES